MTEKLKQVIKREIEKLPKENQEAIGVVDWARITEEIGKKYSFTEVDLNNLQVQTLLVLIGLEDPDFYTQKIETEVVTSKTEAQKIAEEVLQKIFIPINNILLEKIKKNGKVKDADHEQNLNFVLSGGNYSAFVEKSQAINDVAPEEGPKTGTPPVKPAQQKENSKPGYTVDPYRMKPE